MEPKSFSATSLHVAELCLARYEAEHLHRGRGVGGSAASLGSAVHGALELYVKGCYIAFSEQPSLKLLLDLYRMSYMSVFATADASGEMYDDGEEMLTRWYERTDLSNIKVLSCEVKESFDLPTSIGPIPFNYIWDRFDKISDTEIAVIDYKTNRWGISPQELRQKIQARCYGLAAAIKCHTEGMDSVERVWVRFDLLRHDPVGVVFTREDNAATWKFLKEAAERIIATPAGSAPETLNPECRFCVRKTSCSALQRNIAAGGAFAIETLDEAVNKRAALEWQIKAINSAIEELDNWIFTDVKERDIVEYETDIAKLGFTVSSRRAVDGAMVAKVIGEDLFQRYGGLQITMGQFDKLLKDKTLKPEQVAQLKGLVFKNNGEPRVSIKPKDPIDED